MRLIFGFIVVFIFAWIFSQFQGFIDFLINFGIMPEKYKSNQTFDVMMIFVVYAIFMTTAFLIGGTIIIFFWLLDGKLKRNYKKAKKRAEKEFGSKLPYFYFLEPGIAAADINFDKSCYVHEVCQEYLYDTKYQNWDKVDSSLNKLSDLDKLKLYFEAIDYLEYPNMSEEYGIFFSYEEAYKELWLQKNG